MTTSERFAVEAERLQWLEGAPEGTPMPFVARGRDPRVGLDCVGHVRLALARAGVRVADRPYVLGPGVDLWAPMCEALDAALDRLPEGEPWRRGDVLGSRYERMRNHLGVYLGRTLAVHASDGGGLMRVVVSPLDPAHRRMVRAAWRIREGA